MSATTSKQFIAAKGCDYEGVVVDVYATEGEEGWEMSSVTLAGDSRDLLPLLGAFEFNYFDALVDRLWLADCRTERHDLAMDRAASLLMGVPM
jgi:hypothetical protein